MKNLFFFLSFIFLISCSSNQAIIKVAEQEVHVPNPPNMVQVDGNFFADKTELSNMDWKEYLFWLKEKHGEKSDLYQTALPDTTVWRNKEYHYGEPFVETYFSHPAYMDYPVVGISYEQAKLYCKWRTDRVAEMMLIQKKLIPSDGSLYFTFGETKIPQAESIMIPVFRLPSVTEWEMAAYGGLDPQQYPFGFDKGKVKRKYKGMKMHNCKYLNPRQQEELQKKNPKLHEGAYITAPSKSYVPNNYGIHNAVGNVAEMTTKKGISKGGSFVDHIKDSEVGKHKVYKGPQCWLGFRCVASYEKL